MMRDSKLVQKITAFALVSVIAFTLIAPVYSAPSDIPYNERVTAVEAEKINNAIAEFETALEKANNRDKVFEEYNKLLQLASRNGDIHSINMIELEKLNYGADVSHTREYFDKNIADAVSFGEDIKAAVKSALDSSYAKDFEEYWGEEKTEHVRDFNAKEETEIKAKQGKEFYDKYYELLDAQATSMEFTKLLRDIIEYDNAGAKEAGYDNYLDFVYAEENAGFDTHDINEYLQKVCMTYESYLNKFNNYARTHGLSMTGEAKEPENPLEALSYVAEIDERLKNDYEYLVKNNLCRVNNGAQIRGFTSPMNSYGDAVIFVNGASAMKTLIHEFGHYQSLMHTELSAEDVFFGYAYGADTQEINSQAFELISLDYYDRIYGADGKRISFNTLMRLAEGIMYAGYAAVEAMLYSPEWSRENMSDADIDEMMRTSFGEEWYKICQQFFTSQGNYINYSITMFDALQIYDLYLKDREAGLDKYFEACQIGKGSYTEITEKLGLVSAFDDNAKEVLESVTSDIFKSAYGVDYKTALDYFENETYLGKVFPTVQRVSINGGTPQTLYAYNSSGYNYIGIRDLAVLLNGTSAQFDVTYDAQTATVNMLTDKAYTPDGSELNSIPEVETAGQKAAGTYALQLNGETVAAGGMVFVNGRNYFLLRGIAENNLLNIDIDYDEKNDVVNISTRQ